MQSRGPVLQACSSPVCSCFPRSVSAQGRRHRPPAATSSRWPSTSSTRRGARRRCSCRRRASHCSSTAAIPAGATPIGSWPRIADAGVTQIDYLLTTHYHVDHIGGMQELAKRIPIGTFIDHGPTVEEREQVAGLPAGVRGAVRQGEAPGGQAGRPACRSPASTGAIVTAGGQRAEDAAAGRRQAQSRVRGVHAEGHHDRSRERAVGRQRRHVRAVPHASTSAICCGTRRAS